MNGERASYLCRVRGADRRGTLLDLHTPIRTEFTGLDQLLLLLLRAAKSGEPLPGVPAETPQPVPPKDQAVLQICVDRLENSSMQGILRCARPYPEQVSFRSELELLFLLNQALSDTTEIEE